MAVLVPLENERGEGAGHSPRQRAARTNPGEKGEVARRSWNKEEGDFLQEGPRERRREREREGSSLDLPWRRTKKGKGKWRQRAGHASSSLWSRLDPCFCHATTVNEPGTPARSSSLTCKENFLKSKTRVWKRNVFNRIEYFFLDNVYTSFEQFFYYFLSFSKFLYSHQQNHWMFNLYSWTFIYLNNWF